MSDIQNNQEIIINQGIRNEAYMETIMEMQALILSNLSKKDYMEVWQHYKVNRFGVHLEDALNKFDR